MNRHVRFPILALAMLAVPGAALAWHPANDPSVGYNVEALDQAHAAYLAAHPQEHAFAPRGGLPTSTDFLTTNLGLHPVNVQPPRPYLVYSLREPGRFTFELQRMDDQWLTLGISN